MRTVLPLRQGLGIDVSKDTLHVCLTNLEADQHVRVRASTKFANTPAGWKQLSAWLAKHRLVDVPLFVVLEATGIYHEGVTYHLQAQGEHVSVVLPSQAKAFAKSVKARSKTDAIDARLLAHFAAERALPAWRPPVANLRRLKRLCRERMELQEQKTIALNQAHARAHSQAPEADAQRRSKALIQFLKKQIQQIETQIEKTIAADANLQRKVQQICQVKGLGRITVATIIAETDGFALFTRKGQLVRFAGYDVIVEDSGTSVKGVARISRQGSKHLRRALHFPALVAVKYEKHFRDLFERVFARTTIKMKAYVAVQRKLLVLIYTLYKTDAAYDPNHAQQKQAALQKNRQELLPA
jgi:transposase